MKTNRGKLSIEMDCNNQAIVIFEPKEEIIWMNRNEVCELFGVYLKTIDRHLAEIIETRGSEIDALCRYYPYTKGNKICYDITEVNFEIILTLAFRIDSPQAIILRKWFVEQCLKFRQLDFPFVGTEQNYLWN